MWPFSASSSHRAAIARSILFLKDTVHMWSWISIQSLSEEMKHPI